MKGGVFDQTSRPRQREEGFQTEKLRNSDQNNGLGSKSNKGAQEVVPNEHNSAPPRPFLVPIPLTRPCNHPRIV